MQFVVRSRLLWNGIVRLAAYTLAAAILLILTPYLIRHLGIEAYAFVSIGNSALNYMAMGAVAITAVLGRNLLFSLERRRLDDANRQLTTALGGLLAIVTLTALVGLVGVAHIEYLLVVPRDLTDDVRHLFQFIIMTFAVTTLSLPYGAAMFVRNRLDISSAMGLARQAATALLVMCTFALVRPSLATYGCVIGVVAVIFAVSNIAICKRLLPELSVRPQWLDVRLLAGLFLVGGWVTLNHLGSLLYLQPTS
jgi:membrane protein EpsK